jgi:hypothetical protein
VPEADQALSCRVALVGGHLRKEGLHVLDPLKGSFDTGRSSSFMKTVANLLNSRSAAK